MGMLLVTFFVMLLIVTAMSVGVLFGRGPITGSCGGVGAALGDDDYVCDLCGNDENKCKELNDDPESADTDLAYNVSENASEDNRKQ